MEPVGQLLSVTYTIPTGPGQVIIPQRQIFIGEHKRYTLVTAKEIMTGKIFDTFHCGLEPFNTSGHQSVYLSSTTIYIYRSKDPSTTKELR